MIRYIFIKRMQDYFFSKNNIINLSNELGHNLGVPINDKNAIKNCAKMLHQAVMPNIWNKYKTTILKNNYAPEKVIKYLNKKSIEMSTNLYNEKQNKKSTSQMAVDREKEIFGNRKTPYMKQPQQSHNKQSKKNEMNGFETNNEFGNYANIMDDIRGSKPFFRADGRIGENFDNGINQNEFLDVGKKKKEASNDIEKRLAEQMESRNLTSMIPNNQNNTNQNNMFGYNSNLFGQQKPPEINFCRDGGDTRGKIQNQNQNDNSFTNMYENMNMNTDMNMNFGNNNDFENYGGLTNGMENQFDNSTMEHMMQMQMQNKNNNHNNNHNNNNNQMEQMMNMFQSMMTAMMGTNPNINMMNNNIENKDIDKQYIKKSNEFKTSIANSYGLDPESLLNKSSAEIEKIIKNRKPKKINYDSDSNSSKSSKSSQSTKSTKSTKSTNSEKSENSNKNNKLKKKQNKTEKKNKNEKKNKTETKKSKNILEKIEKLAELKKKNIETMKKHKKQLQKSKSDSEQKTESESENNSSDNNSLNKNNKDNKDNKNVKKINNNEDKNTKQKTINIIVDTNKINKNPLYNGGYMMEFKDFYKNLINKDDKICNITKILLKNINIQFLPTIKKPVNTLNINYNNEEYEISIDNGKYDFKEISNDFNNNNECNILIEETENGHTKIYQTNSEEFSMDLSDKSSIGYLFGFNKKKYEGETYYISENRHVFNAKPIYLYIININKCNPFAKINPNGKIEQLIENFEEPINLYCLIIQFRNKELLEPDECNNDDDLINFGELHHIIKFDFILL